MKNAAVPSILIAVSHCLLLRASAEAQQPSKVGEDRLARSCRPTHYD